MRLRCFSRSPRGASGSAALAALLCVALLVPAGLGAARAAFVAPTSSAGSLAASALFPTYPQAVVADSPLFYHRFDEPAGSVTAADSSGNGRRGVYAPRVYGGPRAIWALDEGSGTTAADLSGAVSVNNLTVDPSTWVSGQSGAGLSFNGTSQYAASGSTGVDTSVDFSVSAWVYLADASVSRTAVSQVGTAVSGFELGYDQPLNAWVFRLPQSNSAAATVDVAAGGTVALNTWTYLTGTLTGTTMTLYVNGVRVGTQPTHSTAWNATGVVEVGAGRSTTRTRYWSGRLDDVRLYTGSLGVNSTSDVAMELVAGVTGGPLTSWQFDDTTGSTVTDASGAANTATLANGATWNTTTKKWGASAGSFDGTDDHVTGRYPAVTTTAGFSVAAWVYLTDNTVSRVAASQDGASASRFTLGYHRGTDRWSFEMARTDVGAPVKDRAVAGSAPTLNAWVQLVGVYDPTATGAELKLYVGGAAAGTAAHTASWPATGTAVAGAAKAGTRASHWHGHLDDVRFYGRALSATEVGRITSDATAVTNPSNPNLGRATLGVPGSLQGVQQGQQASTAMAVSSARNSFNPLVVNDPVRFTVECWFRAAAPGGRALITFGSSTSGNTGGGGSRRLFMDASGNIGYGQSASTTILSSGVNYADGAWHHLAATADPDSGIFLYVDGARAASRAYVAAVSMTGYWRWNGDTWGGAWGSDYNFTSSIDEVAVYPAALSAQQVAWHYHANH